MAGLVKYQEILITLSEEDFNSFLSNPVWGCIKEFLKERINLTIDDLENAPKEDMIIQGKEGSIIVDGVQKFQGALKELRGLYNAPEDLRGEMKHLREEQDNDTE